MSVSDFEPDENAVHLWPDQVIRTEWVDPEQLLAHELNPNIHPMPQARATEGSMDELGWVRHIVVNERTGKVIDGHLRVGIAISRGALVPVDYVNFTDEQELLALALLDATGDMRGTDREIQQDLAAALPDISDVLASVIAVSASKFDQVKEPPEDPTDPGPGGGDVERADADAFLFGYVRWKTNRVDCTGEETEGLTKLHLSYLAENNGKDEGFVEWLTRPRLDTLA